MLKLQGLYKSFHPGTVNERTALAGVDLTLNPGDFVTVIGSNGAGKSTLLGAIAGSFYVDRGRILLDGEDITYQPAYRRSGQIGRLFQDPSQGTAPNLTIEENLAIAAGRGAKRRWISSITPSQRDFFREELSLFEMGLENRLTCKVGQLSGGQRQALALLMATIRPPKLLLLDEHTAALDPAAAQKVLEMTQLVVQRGHLAALMVTHNIQAAFSVGNRTIVMGEGKILKDLTQSQRQSVSPGSLLAYYV